MVIASDHDHGLMWIESRANFGPVIQSALFRIFIPRSIPIKEAMISLEHEYGQILPNMKNVFK